MDNITKNEVKQLEDKLKIIQNWINQELENHKEKESDLREQLKRVQEEIRDLEIKK